MQEPVIFSDQTTTAIGSSLIIHEWRGSGPEYARPLCR